MCKTEGQLCHECNQPMGASTRDERRFCSVRCKDRSNNRRKNRGAELYDLFMNIRFNREAAKEAGLWAVMCRMASEWNAEDKGNLHKPNVAEEDRRAPVKSFAPVQICKERSISYGVRGRS